MWTWLWRNAQHGKDEALRMFGDLVSTIPIPTPSEPARAEAAERVALSVADPASLSADQFLAEVKKRRPKGTGSPAPAALAELKGAHEDTRLPLLRLRKQVSESEAALATLVHAAFGLGPEDLDLLRHTQPPRTPPGLG